MFLPPFKRLSCLAGVGQDVDPLLFQFFEAGVVGGAVNDNRVLSWIALCFIVETLYQFHQLFHICRLSFFEVALQLITNPV